MFVAGNKKLQWSDLVRLLPVRPLLKHETDILLHGHFISFCGTSGYLIVSALDSESKVPGSSSGAVFSKDPVTYRAR